jgi:anti-sigma B factor antagonist
MEVHKALRDGVAVLSMKGKLTLGEGDDLLREAVQAVLDEGAHGIVLDLSQVPYIDSAGLGEIVRSYTSVTRTGGKLVLVGLTKRIDDLLSITKLKTVFDIFDSEADAVRSFSN